MSAAVSRTRSFWFLLAALTPCVFTGCRMVSREKMEECHRLSQTLRAENSQLKDQVLVLRNQNQDLSERSVDDVRRMAQLEEVNNRLEESVRVYQDERGRLESAYKELRASLPGSLKPLSLNRPDLTATSDTPPAPDPVGPAARKPGAWVPSQPEKGISELSDESEP